MCPRQMPSTCYAIHRDQLGRAELAMRSSTLFTRRPLLNSMPTIHARLPACLLRHRGVSFAVGRAIKEKGAGTPVPFLPDTYIIITQTDHPCDAPLFSDADSFLNVRRATTTLRRATTLRDFSTSNSASLCPRRDADRRVWRVAFENGSRGRMATRGRPARRA